MSLDAINVPTDVNELRVKKKNAKLASTADESWKTLMAALGAFDNKVKPLGQKDYWILLGDIASYVLVMKTSSS